MASKKSRKRGVELAAVGRGDGHHVRRRRRSSLRLVQLQVIDHSQYAAEARDIHVSQETLTERRGALLDRNGYPLAASKDTYDVMVERDAWKDPRRPPRPRPRSRP